MTTDPESGHRDPEADGGRDEPDRRACPRHLAREPRAWLGCWIEEGFEVEAVMVLDISRGGLALEMEFQPQVNQDVWVRLHGGEGSPSARARVVGVGPGSRGRFRTRLRFPRPCLDAFYTAVIRGKRRIGPRAELQQMCGS